MHLDKLHPDCLAVGLGRPTMTTLPPIPADDLSTPECWIKAAYVLGQQEPVFNSDAHFKHKDRLRSKHEFIKTSRSNLVKHKPELSAALQIAKDPAIPDDQIASDVHKFIRSSRPPT